MDYWIVVCRLDLIWVNVEVEVLNEKSFSGGVTITLDAEKMGELINLEPTLVLDDCNSENVINTL